MKPAERLIILIGVIALITIPSIMFVVNRVQNAPSTATSTADTVPKPGAPGAIHWHAAFLLDINGQAINFGNPKYMLQSKLAHFEDNNPVILHKHTTGVTIPFFLSTLKIFLTNDCIDFKDSDIQNKFCTNATNTLQMLVNGARVTDIERYDVQNNDRILLVYGGETGANLKLLFNQVPVVPTFREITEKELQQEQDAADTLTIPQTGN